MIDGRGDILFYPELIRPHILFFRGCCNVRVRDLKLYNAAFWVQKYQSCNNLLIDGVTVDSRENKDIEKPRYADVPGRNTDGCNIVDCSNVRITNCHIVSGDDGIVFKSFARNEGCHQVTVSNCIISTNAAGIKIGTETAGVFRDFTINNCVVYDTRGSGIGIMTVDGSIVERILVSNITLRNIKGTAIFIRIGNRNRPYGNGEVTTMSTMKDVLIQNVYGTGIERYGCSITGIPDAFVEGITLDNIQLSFTGGLDPLYFEGNINRPEKVLTVDNVPEKEKDYPRSEMFGKLPAYGFYIRHANNIKFNNVTLDYVLDENRPALVADDVNGLLIDRLHAKPTKSPLIYLKNVQKATVSHAIVTDETPVFLYLSGSRTKNIRLISNQLESVKKKADAENPVLLNQIKEYKNEL